MTEIPANPPVTGTGICCVPDNLPPAAVFFELTDGSIDEATHRNGAWANSELAVKPVSASPLAAVTYNTGKDIRLYYLDNNHVIQEYCYTEGKNWYPGDIGKLNVKVTAGSGLAAIVTDSPIPAIPQQFVPGIIHVYYQEAGSFTIKELTYDGQWQHGDLQLSGALAQTSLAAVTYIFQSQTQIRIYYQANDLSLKEYCHNDSGWFQGVFNPGKAAAHTPLGALAFGAIELQVYWRNPVGRVVLSTNTGNWNDPAVIQPIEPGYKFGVLQMDNGSKLRLYYQLFDGAVVEYYSNDSGKTWTMSKEGVSNVAK